eukprot:6173702-Pleurochrysis_carterae.AAC.2
MWGLSLAALAVALVLAASCHCGCGHVRATRRRDGRSIFKTTNRTEAKIFCFRRFPKLGSILIERSTNIPQTGGKPSARMCMCLISCLPVRSLAPRLVSRAGTSSLASLQCLAFCRRCAMSRSRRRSGSSSRWTISPTRCTSPLMIAQTVHAGARKVDSGS